MKVHDLIFKLSGQVDSSYKNFAKENKKMVGQMENFNKQANSGIMNLKNFAGILIFYTLSIWENSTYILKMLYEKSQEDEKMSQERCLLFYVLFVMWAFSGMVFGEDANSSNPEIKNQKLQIEYVQTFNR